MYLYCALYNTDCFKATLTVPVIHRLKTASVLQYFAVRKQLM